ncbi:Uncharacterised protein [Candidatus Norongarragalina meridionalis]|nr:Uncharacterised protein [Candidatus Norongarragalina meridionalis]
MNCKNIVFGAIAFAVIAQVVHMAEAMLTMSYYTDPAYFDVWSKVMMPGPGAPPMSFYLYSISFALIAGALFTYVYTVVRNGLPKKGAGVKYGALVWLVAGLPGSMTMYLLFNLPASLFAIWAATALIVHVAAGWAVEKIAG